MILDLLGVLLSDNLPVRVRKELQNVVQLLQCYLRAAELEMRTAEEPMRSDLDVAGLAGGKEPTDNRFLSHAEGQWYFLHRVERESEDKTNHWFPPNYRTVALEDGQVEHVRVSPNPPRASRVAPLPLGLGRVEAIQEPLRGENL